MATAPDGRIFVTQQSGALRVIKNGALLTTPFITLTVDSDGERGLIGIALDPTFTTNHFIYLYHTVPGAPAHNRISRYTANGDVVVAGSEVVLLDLNALSATATNHNGGGMVFGKDGKLYVGVGENATRANAQNINNYLGKVLRLNPDGSAPADNPFPTGSESAKRIWAYGLRNPYTLAVQPGTGRILVNDVGENTWEEINDATTGGQNFGWPDAEGATCTGPSCATNTSYSYPVYAYAHGTGDGIGCSIAGGVFYNPAINRYPASFTGKYFYQDYCNNWINVLDVSSPTAVRSAFATGLAAGGVDLMLGTDGYLYRLSRGSLYRIIYTGPVPDLTMILHAQPSTINGTTPVSLVVNVYELNSVPTSGIITVHITKDPLLSLTFNPQTTTIGGYSVQNNGWSFDALSDPNVYILSTTQTIGAGPNLSVGLSGTLTPGNTKGNLSISAVVEGSAVGEVQLLNNADAERIDYFNK